MNNKDMGRIITQMTGIPVEITKQAGLNCTLETPSKMTTDDPRAKKLLTFMKTAAAKFRQRVSTRYEYTERDGKTYTRITYQMKALKP